MQKRRRGNERRSILFLVFVMIIMIGVVSVQISRLYIKNENLEKEKAELQMQIQEAQQKQVELEELKEYMKTTDYIEEVGREKFGLIKPGDTLFVLETEE